MLYTLHQFNRALLDPAANLARAGAQMFSAPGSWLSRVPGAANIAAGYELFYRLGKSYPKPQFAIDRVDVLGVPVPVSETVALSKPFCLLRRFDRTSDRPELAEKIRTDPIVLLVAPLSGHHATLLRDTVRALLSDHTVFLTDWVDARTVPVDQGLFPLADYVDYLRAFTDHLGADRTHVVAVCQAAVPALGATALMAAAGRPTPPSLVLMGGPIDSRCSPTAVNRFATSHSLAWFDKNMIQRVPAAFPGRNRRVYPGFLQHAGFVAMNPLAHFHSHWDFYRDLIDGNVGGAAGHRGFYDEYNAVLDMPAEYYLDCISAVFQQHLLPRGLWQIGGAPVAPRAITGTALLTVEGENDDISGLGQTRAALDLCSGVANDRKHHLEVAGAGHYGIFSGRRWRANVYPAVRAFIAAADVEASSHRV